MAWLGILGIFSVHFLVTYWITGDAMAASVGLVVLVVLVSRPSA